MPIALPEDVAKHMQQQHAGAMIRLNLASSILAQLSAIDFANGLRQAHERDNVIPGSADDETGQNIEFVINPETCAKSAIRYADELMIGLGMAVRLNQG